jgi:general secretion pathway protein D
MTRLTKVLVPIGMLLTMESGLLHAQPASPEGRAAHPTPIQNEALPVLIEPGTLAATNLDFTRGARLGEVFLTLGKASGVNILLHVSAAALEISTSADLRGMSFQRALDALMLQNDLFYKVLDPHSIMVFKKTVQNLQDFEPKSIKTLYLANAEVDAVRQNLNALMPQLRVFVDKRLNCVTVSCSASDLAKATQVINNLDRARGEVRLQMEIIEVSQKASAAAGLLPGIGTVPSPELKAISPERALAKVMQDGGARLLANPALRVVSGEAAEVRVGSKPALAQAAVSAKTTQNDSTGKPEVAGQSLQSDDLGMRIKVRPRLHPDHEISLDLEYHVTDPVSSGKPGHSSLSERYIKTSVRLKDGETVVFGGLLEDQQRAGGAKGTSDGKEKKDRVLVVKASVVRRGEQ